MWEPVATYCFIICMYATWAFCRVVRYGMKNYHERETEEQVLKHERSVR